MTTTKSKEDIKNEHMQQVHEELRAYGYTCRYRYGGNLYAARIGSKPDKQQEVLLGDADRIESMEPEQRAALYKRRLGGSMNVPQPEPLPGKTIDLHMTGYMHNGDEIEVYVEQDASTSYVSIQSSELGYLQFDFNPDFPEDARRFFVALAEVIAITQEGK